MLMESASVIHQSNAKLMMIAREMELLFGAVMENALKLILNLMKLPLATLMMSVKEM